MRSGREFELHERSSVLATSVENDRSMNSTLNRHGDYGVWHLERRRYLNQVLKVAMIDRLRSICKSAFMIKHLDLSRNAQPLMKFIVRESCVHHVTS